MNSRSISKRELYLCLLDPRQIEGDIKYAVILLVLLPQSNHFLDLLRMLDTENVLQLRYFRNQQIRIIFSSKVKHMHAMIAVR